MSLVRSSVKAFSFFGAAAALAGALAFAPNASAQVDASADPAAGQPAGKKSFISDYGLFVEPGVTYELGSTETKFSDWTNGLLSNSTGDANGFGLVGRAGIHIGEIFFVGLDGRYNWLKFKDSSNNLTSDATMYTLAPIVGAQMPIKGLRVWGGYIVASEMDPERAGDYDFKFREGTGFLLGAGFQVEPVSINIEYKNVNFAKTDVERGPLGVALPDRNIDAEDNAWVASVSFPFAL